VILRRYLFREIILTFAGVFVLLLLVFVSRSMVEYLGEAASGKLPVGAILSLMGLLVVNTLSLLVPLCLFIGILFALGRMQHDNEVIAMAGAGLGGNYLIRNVTQLATVFAIGIAACSLVFGPWAMREMKTLKARAEQESDITGITPGRFKEFSDGSHVLFVRNLSTDRKQMQEVFLQIRDAEKLSVLSAHSAMLATEEGTGNRFVLFRDGSRYKGTPGRADYEVTHYQNFGVRIDRGDGDAVLENTKGMPTSKLLVSDDPTNIAELQWRISVPIMTLLLAVFAVSLLRLLDNGNRYVALLIAVLVYFTYSNMLVVARTLLKKEELPPIVGMWWVHLAMAAIILLMEWHPALVRWWRQRRLIHPQPVTG
jgi:lipopolysaccharide export system permease protein